MTIRRRYKGTILIELNKNFMTFVFIENPAKPKAKLVT
jgi:hypothetical protein